VSKLYATRSRSGLRQRWTATDSRAIPESSSSSTSFAQHSASHGAAANLCFCEFQKTRPKGKSLSCLLPMSSGVPRNYSNYLIVSRFQSNWLLIRRENEETRGMPRTLCVVRKLQLPSWLDELMGEWIRALISISEPFEVVLISPT
jgi:hypothetical protein